jgi:hypothetical protein
VSFAALQALDVHSTLSVLDTGAGREANPVAGAIVASPAKFVAVKAGVAAGIVLATDRLRKRNPKTALALMIGLNGAYAAIAAHNYSVLGGIATVNHSGGTNIAEIDRENGSRESRPRIPNPESLTPDVP